MSFDRKQFWEEKILGWEAGRYAGGASGGVLEKLADRASDSLRYRIRLGAELLAPFVRGKVVVDVGCGSGLLTGPLLDAGAAAVWGFDIAEAAIASAEARKAEAGWDERAQFRVASVAELPADLRPDFVISLGLVDWLTDEEITRLFAWGGKAEFVHAFSERQWTPAQVLHQLYCWVSYGWRTQGYVPRYDTAPFFLAQAERIHPGRARILRDPGLSFGAIVTTLPAGPGR